MIILPVQVEFELYRLDWFELCLEVIQDLIVIAYNEGL